MRKLVVGACLMLLALSGCAAAPAKADPQAAFRSVVASGDAALAAGDPYRAWELYRQALEATGAVDTGGKVAKAADRAKRLYLARQIVAKDPSTGDVDVYVQVLAKYAVGATETAEAQKRIVAHIEQQRTGMTAEVTEMLAKVRAHDAFERSLDGMIMREFGPKWAAETKTIPGPLGAKLTAACELMGKVGESTEKAWASHDGGAILADLENARTTLERVKSTLAEAQKLEPELEK